MPKVEKMSIELTPEMAALIRECVGSGETASVSEVMREALWDWKERRAKAIEELGRLWDVGMNSGPARDGEECFARMRRNLAARLGWRETE